MEFVLLRISTMTLRCYVRAKLSKEEALSDGQLSSSAFRSGLMRLS